MLSRLPRPRILLAAITSLSLAGGVLGLSAVTWFDHEATIEDWRGDLSVSVLLLESQLRLLHTAARGQLDRIGDRLTERPNFGRGGPESDRRWLEAVAEQVPHGVLACLHGARGRLILSSDGSASPACLRGSESRIRAARSDPGRVRVETIIEGNRAADYLAVFSKALPSTEGGEPVVAEILVRGDYFDDAQRPAQLPDLGNSFLVATLDGNMIARQPLPRDPLFRFDPAVKPFSQFVSSPQGFYRNFSVVDGVERFYSYRRVDDLGMVVTTGMTVSLAFRDWTLRTRRNAGMTAGAMLLLLGLAVIANESLRHESLLLRRMRRKTEELTSALEEKDVLFQEVHHRVKNNLQVISSLLTMQLLHVTDAAARQSLKDCLDRIASMGLVHQTLYERNVAANVDLGAYFGRLAEALLGSYAPARGSITIHVDVNGSLNLERAVPLGMLANEALSNALKHAFPDGRRGTITINLAQSEGQWHFSVRDDGAGMAEQPGSGIGLSLIRALARQLGGRAAISRDGGTLVVVTFPV